MACQILSIDCIALEEPRFHSFIEPQLASTSQSAAADSWHATSMHVGQARKWKTRLTFSRNRIDDEHEKEQ